MSGLYRHKKLHSNDPKYKCIHCQRICPSPSDLRRHLRIHTGEKPFHCDECNKSFTRKNSLGWLFFFFNIMVIYVD